jgi:uncharacterized protein (DUF302 family)
MQTIGTYAFEATTLRPFDEAIARTTELLAEQGFGIVTEIDMRATLQKKLGVEWRPYHILGACNPKFAHRALAAEPHVGVLLPCNVVIWDQGTHRVVTAMEPRLMGDIVTHPDLHALSAEVSERLHAALAKLG